MSTQTMQPSEPTHLDKCRCGHSRRWHVAERHGKTIHFVCVHCDLNCRFCTCKDFVTQSTNEENQMPDKSDAYTKHTKAKEPKAAKEKVIKAKKAKEPKAAKTPKPKKEPQARKPTLAPFIDGPMTLHATYKEKTFEAKVAADGVVTFDGENYTSPSSAGKAAIKKSVDGWRFWRFKKDGEELELDHLRGSKSPLTKTAAA